jgi:Ca2+-binding RTX toxin-like protein
VDARFTHLQYLYGNGGSDTITSGNGPSIQAGGDGNDKLNGGTARDILIGGADADTLKGKGGDDLLIAGSTSFDTPTLLNQLALLAVYAEWGRTGVSYQTRINRLSGGLRSAASMVSSSSRQVVPAARCSTTAPRMDSWAAWIATGSYAIGPVAGSWTHPTAAESKSRRTFEGCGNDQVADLVLMANPARADDGRSALIARHFAFSSHTASKFAGSSTRH